jgi:hypothetical protein
MMLQQYRLDNTILKATDALKLLQSERAIIETDGNTLAVPILLDNQRKGYMFHGHAKLLLDTIVETKEGAMGNSVEKEINEPFLMLGDTEEIQQHLSAADKENLTAMGYKDEQEFIAKAEDLLQKLSRRGKIWHHHCCDDNYGTMFAFSNEAGKLDILVADDSRLTYKAMDRVFIANKRKVVLKTPNEMVLSSNCKSLIIRKRHF